MAKNLTKAPSMASIYARAITKKRDPRYKVGDALPDLALRLSNQPINAKHLARYNDVCGFDQADCVAATYPQILAFPLQLEMLSDKSFPFPLLGLVHVRNAIEVLKPVSRKSTLNIEVRVGEQRVVDKGVEVDVNTEIEADGVLSWRGTATMLYRCKTEVESDASAKKGAEPLSSNRQLWSLPGGLGRSYGVASGDLNPIHLYVATAKLFGFKRAIAHGMWSKARCLAALDGQLPAAPYVVDVRFKRPIFLPGKVQFFNVQKDDATDFELWSARGDEPHLSGSVAPIVE